MLIVTICMLALCACAACAQTWPAQGRSVLEFGAVGDGEVDDTAAFQGALDAAGAANGGAVLVPAGNFNIAGHLSVPPGVTLKGSWTYASSDTGKRWGGEGAPKWGTILLVTEGVGSEEGEPFITLTDQATLQGVILYYPDQKYESEPDPYPWAVRLGGNNSAVIDVELLNPYKGIEAVQAHRFLVRNVQGQPLRLGLFVDQMYDIGRIENVHWNPWWSHQSPVFEWQLNNGEAFVFGRADWQYVHNTFCFGYKVGYRFDDFGEGACNGNFLGIGADNSLIPCLVQRSAPFGLLITNGEFVSFSGDDPTMVVVEETNTGSVRFVNCAYWGPCNQIAKVAGEGTVGFSDCTFVQWDRNNEGRSAVQVEGGTVLIRGCEFRRDAPQVSLGPDVSKAIISENVMRGTVRIDDQSAGKVHIGVNLGDE